jgi:benzoate-CoA ligase family protein
VEDSLTRYNAATDLLGRNLRPERAARPYLITESRTWSYDEVAAAADAAAAGLLDLGIGPGDRVLLALRDRPEFVITFWGTIKAGIVPVPVAQGLSGSEIHFLLGDSEARAAVCDPSSAASVVEAARQTGTETLMVGKAHVGSARPDANTGGGMRSWHEVCGRPAALEPAPTSADDVALWLYTSGTTGLPKAVMHRHRNLGAAYGGLFSQVLGVTQEDVVLSMSKMHFAYGLGNSVYLPAAAGAATVVDAGAAVPARILELVSHRKPSVLFGVPSFFNGFSRLSDAALPASVRAIVSAGEALSADLFERFRARFGMPLLDGLGATEALHHITSNHPDDAVAGCAGSPLHGYSVEVRDRDGTPVEEGTSGELWVKGPTTLAGYWKRPELTARVLQDSWVRTGDQVRLVEGRVWHEGRLDDLIKLGGVWVAPGEIEEVLRGHALVVDAAVVSIDAGTGVPQLRAFVLTESTDPDLPRELLGLCRERLSRFKVPQSFEIVTELPRTPTGKLKRYVLRGLQP